MIFKAALLLFLQSIRAEMLHYADPTCNFIIVVHPGRKVEINNPGFPNLYKKDIKCKWVVNCPPDYLCRLRCRDVALPQSEDCEKDKLLVSAIGSLELNGADMYCGRMFIDTKSVNQRIIMGLISSKSSQGGRFRCIVTAERPI